MKQEGYKLFMKDLEELCNKHGVIIFGGCEQESIYSEVYVMDAKTKVTGINGWLPPTKDECLQPHYNDYGVVFDCVGEQHEY